MAFSTAISGIKAAQANLDVVSNNIANASTVGFKASRAQFAEIYANSVSGGSNAGQGVELTEIRADFSQGSLDFTGSGLDLAISGNGFFIVSNGGASEYTRAGSFLVDRDGFLTNESGNRLQGYQGNTDGVITGELGDLFIDTTLVDPKVTSKVTITSNLDSREATPATTPFASTDPTSYNSTTSTTIYDSLGNSHVLQLYYVKTATANTWDVYTSVDGGTPPAATQISFDPDGTLAAASNNSIAITTPAAELLSAAGVATGAADLTYTVDILATTQLGTDFSVNSATQDGYGAGQLISFEFDDTGTAFARYTNGQSRAIGQVALASFRNNNGLQPVGGSNYVESFGSGSPNIGVPGNSGRGDIQASAVEQANVDITQELVNLIVAQRNFQANAQVISTEDQATQAVINLR
ncbi:flagellar hook protein FlgE [Luminiphilus sp. nBUS_07]|uniref:flagellar hook protein FlgE n=1 Tax=Luminiphilus sp. nBUS_07 TaxID=3395314 RepID=UPI003EBB16B8